MARADWPHWMACRVITRVAYGDGCINIDAMARELEVEAEDVIELLIEVDHLIGMPIEAFTSEGLH